MSRATRGDARRGHPEPHDVGDDRAGRRPERRSRFLAAMAGVVAANAYLVAGVALAGSIGPSLSQRLTPYFVVAALVVVGLPVAAWLRDGLHAPPVLLAAVLAFWHLYVPIFQSNSVETPTFVLALYFAPVYLGAYLLASASERRARAGRGT